MLATRSTAQKLSTEAAAGLYNIGHDENHAARHPRQSPRNTYPLIPNPYAKSLNSFTLATYQVNGIREIRTCWLPTSLSAES